jgi:hypothetical protein
MKACVIMSTALRQPDAAALHAPQIPHELALLRVLAPSCRAKARIDLFQACAMLSNNRAQAAQAYADALLRTLEQGLGRAPVLYRAGSPEISFDEQWLAALFAADARDDQDSFTFLTRARLKRIAVRQIAFLIRSLAQKLQQTN